MRLRLDPTRSRHFPSCLRSIKGAGARYAQLTFGFMCNPWLARSENLNGQSFCRCEAAHGSTEARGNYIESTLGGPRRGPEEEGGFICLGDV